MQSSRSKFENSIFRKPGVPYRDFMKTDIIYANLPELYLLQFLKGKIDILITSSTTWGLFTKNFSRNSDV